MDNVALDHMDKDKVAQLKELGLIKEEDKEDEDTLQDNSSR